jgi:adenylate cyclase
MLGSFLVVTAYRQLTEERAKRHIKRLFAHAISPALVDRLLEDPSLAELGGQKRELSCMFTDLGGFTSLSESLGPQETVRLLNRYFDRAAEVIQDRCGGYLNKFLGDGIFAFFGAPVFQTDHARRAIEAAVQCQGEIVELNKALAAEGGPDIQLSLRVGITTGEAMVGNCGSTQRMDYTAIGDCVNLASRLEQANKFFGTGILVDEHSWGAAGLADVPARLLGKVLVAGLAEPVNVWEVLAPADGEPGELPKALDDFTQAVELLASRNFEAAAETFERLRELLPDDKPTQLYLEVCRQYVAQPPDESWTGHVFDVSH